MTSKHTIQTFILLLFSVQLLAQTYAPTEYVSVCSNQGTYYWHGQECNKSGKYTDDQGDIIYTLQLTMDDAVRQSKSFQMPEGGSVKFNGKWYTKSGVYYDTISGGETYCDTIYKIAVSYALSYQFYDTIHKCGYEPVMWQGQMRYKAQNYVAKYRTADNRADSVYHLALFFDDKTRDYYETKYGCKSKLPYIWNGLKLYEDCDTIRTLTTKYGCDSIVHLHFEILNLPASHTVTNTSFCAGEGIYTHGIQLHSKRTFSDTLLSFCGCDSIIDSIFTPYPTSFFKMELAQHFKGKPYTWRGKNYTADGYYYDTLPDPDENGCYNIYAMHLVTKYEIYNTTNLCEGEIAEYKSHEGKIQVTTESHFKEEYKSIFGGDSIVYFDFYFQPKKVIKTDSITICGNEKYTWTYADKSMVIEGKDYRNQTKTNVSQVEMKINKCEVAQMIVTVVPYYITDSLVIMCNEDVKANPFTWTDHYGHDYVFGQPDVDKTILDTLNAPIFHEPGQPAKIGECPNIMRFRFISTNTCSAMDTFAVCQGDSVMIDKKWYKEPGTYKNIMASVTHKDRGVKDSVHNFTIIRAQVDTITRTEYRCESEPPFEFNGKSYTESTLDTIHLKYKGQSCDSAVIFLTVITKPRRIAPIQEYHFCSNDDIQVSTPSGKVLTTPGYHTDTIHMAFDLGCDSILQYFIYTHEATDITETDYIRPGETYHWTYHGKDSLITTPGIYVDSTKVGIYGCDSIRTLVLNLNEPLYALTTATGCSNNLPYVWRGKYFYNDTTVIDTIYDNHKDSIFELRLTVAAVYDTLRLVSLLPDKTYNFYGTELTLNDTNKIYRVALPSLVTGCDSIERVRIIPVLPTIIDTILCPGQSIERDDIVNNQYADTTTHDGSWYITIHQISYDKKVISKLSQQIKQGESYLWQRCKGDTLLTLTGEYLDTCVNRSGCDSIIMLKLIVGKDKLYKDTDSVCYNDLPYFWHGQSLDETGTYTARYTTSLGYDSVFTIDFKVIQPIHVNVKIDTCYTGQPIYINNRPYRKNTAFVDTFTSVRTHCDSIVHYVLELHYPVTSYEQKQITEGSSIVWHGQTISSGGIYTHHAITPYGCDSTITLILTECPKAAIGYRSIFACEGDVIRINGDTIRESGTYPEINKTANGCDSTVLVNVKFSYTDWKYTSISMHKYDTIHWRDKNYTKPGIYYDTIKTSNLLCDSVIYCLYLQMVKIIERDTTVLSCDGSYYHKGKGPYYQDSTIVDTIPNLDGKDSVYVNWHYRLIDHCSKFDSYYLCPGETRDIEGVRVTSAGTYYAPRLTDQGEDSLYRFTVKDAHVYENTIKLNGCDSVVYGGKTYLYHGIDEPTYQTIHHTSVQYGCDSIEHLVITLHGSKRNYDRISIADYQLPFEYNGRTYYASSRDTFNYFTTPYGCDSLLILVLDVLPTTNDTTYQFYCKGDPNGVDIFGKKYFPEHDIVVDSLFHVGDDMIRRTVIVRVNQPFTIKSFDPMPDQIVCATNKLTFYVQYDVVDQSTGSMPTSYDVDFSVGDLDAHPKHATYSINTKKTLPIDMDGLGSCVNPGYYSYTIRFHSDGCPVSDTIVTGSIMVRYPSTIMEANWNNVVALVNSKYNAGQWDLVPPYAWQVWDYAGAEKSSMVIPNDPNQAYIASDNMRENDVVIATLFRDGYGRAVPSCPFTFIPVNYSASPAVVVYPTTARTRSMVHVETEETGEYQIFTATGHKCQRGSLLDGDNTLQLPATVGCYLLHVTLQDGTTKLQRLIVY